MSILGQLPLPSTVLELGCGDRPDPLVHYAAQPEIVLFGVDHDLTLIRAVHIPRIYLAQADIGHLPFRTRFDLVVARHPDVECHASAWQATLTSVATLLTKDGLLIVTTYSLPEIESVDAWMAITALARFPITPDGLAPPGLQGCDRFVRCWRNL